MTFYEKFRWDASEEANSMIAPEPWESQARRTLGFFSGLMKHFFLRPKQYNNQQDIKGKKMIKLRSKRSRVDWKDGLMIDKAEQKRPVNRCSILGGNVAALFTDLDVDRKGFITLQAELPCDPFLWKREEIRLRSSYNIIVL